MPSSRKQKNLDRAATVLKDPVQFTMTMLNHRIWSRQTGDLEIGGDVSPNRRKGVSCEWEDVHCGRGCLVVDYDASGGDRRDHRSHLDASGTNPVERNSQNGVLRKNPLPKKRLGLR